MGPMAETVTSECEYVDGTDASESLNLALSLLISIESTTHSIASIARDVRWAFKKKEL